MVTNSFLANSGTCFYKLDIFKNVQNEKSKMNLERPFFHDSSRYNKNGIRSLSNKPQMQLES